MDFKKEILPLKNTIFRMTSRFLRNREDAEDACQDILLKLWEKRSTLKKFTSIKAFVLTITKNHCIDKLRSKKYDTVELYEESTAGIGENPEQVLIKSEVYNNIENMINSLPENLRLTIHLRDIEGCTSNEVAEILGITNANVRVNLSRARKQIRKLLTKMNI